MTSINKSKKVILIINISVILLLLGLTIGLAIYNWDYLKGLTTPEGQLAFKDRIDDIGFLGAIVLLLVQILQIVVAFIPGEFVEIVAGMLFGPIGGMFLCIAGLFLGSLAIFGLVKVLGKPFMDLNVDENKKKRLKFLEDETRALTILFFIFLVPGTPKDFITYAIPFTKIKFLPFIIVTTIARIPSIITSTLIGASVMTGETEFAMIVTIVTFVLAALGILFNKPITNLIEKIASKRKKQEV